MSSGSNNKALADVNSRFVAEGEILPVVTLPDGSKVQTGTVGALVQNIKLYDRICAGEIVEGLTKEELEKMMEVPIPTLAHVGLLDIFPPDEWLRGSAGRRFLGAKMKELGY